MDTRTLREQRFWQSEYSGRQLDALPEDLRRIGPLYNLETDLFGCDFLFTALGNPAGARVLSIGGGIDGTALWMAQQRATVSCLDLAPAAMTTTQGLAERMGLADRVRCDVGRCEDLRAHDAFDIVLCRKALHHMDVRASLERIRAALTIGGVFLAYEPVCLSAWLARVHDRLPFHPDYPVTDDEHVLSLDDLAEVRAVFPGVAVHYFDLVTRPSLAYFIGRLGLRRTLRPLGRIDYHIIRTIPWLSFLSSSVVIKAVSSGT